MNQAPEQQMAAAIEHTLRQGDAVGALARCAAALQRLPFAAPFQYFRAVAFSRMGEGAEAAAEISALVPRLPAEMRGVARLEIARAWLVAGSPESALVVLDEVAEPAGVERDAIRVEALTALGRHDEASATLRAAGERPAAEPLDIAMARLALDAEPDGRGPRSEEALARLTGRVAQAGGAAGPRCWSLHLLGELHARRREDEAAWGAFRRSAKLSHHAHFEPQRYGADVAALLRAWPEKQIARLAGAPADRGGRVAPVFIMGYPDGLPEVLAGLLSAHPAVGRSQHTDVFTIVAAQFLGGQRTSAGPLVLAPSGVGAQRLAEGGAYYLQHALGERGLERTVDTAYGLVHHGGALALAMPWCRVVWIERDPVSSCMAAFLGPFRPQIAPTHDTVKAATYRRAFGEMWGRWRAIYAARGTAHLVLPAERLLAEPEAAARQVLSFLGVDDRADLSAAADRARAAMRATRFAPDLPARFPTLRAEFERLFASA